MLKLKMLERAEMLAMKQIKPSTPASRFSFINLVVVLYGIARDEDVRIKQNWGHHSLLPVF